MPQPINISDAEWEVMRVLWATSEPRTANHVVDALAGRKDWNPRTVKTLLNRLTKKRAITFEACGKVYWYSPRVTQDDCAKREGRSFLARVFGGDSAAMLVHFVKDAKLSPSEVAELKRLLGGKEK
jgi:BlaI family transcriptional regulator, penicillinase repressor